MGEAAGVSGGGVRRLRLQVTLLTWPSHPTATPSLPGIPRNPGHPFPMDLPANSAPPPPPLGGMLLFDGMYRIYWMERSDWCGQWRCSENCREFSAPACS
jgi:hypothetical protein